MIKSNLAFIHFGDEFGTCRLRPDASSQRATRLIARSIKDDLWRVKLNAAVQNVTHRCLSLDRKRASVGYFAGTAVDTDKQTGREVEPVTEWAESCLRSVGRLPGIGQSACAAAAAADEQDARDHQTAAAAVRGNANKLRQFEAWRLLMGHEHVYRPLGLHRGIPHGDMTTAA
jgi:hypothetical protein